MSIRFLPFLALLAGTCLPGAHGRADLPSKVPQLSNPGREARAKVTSHPPAGTQRATERPGVTEEAPTHTGRPGNPGPTGRGGGPAFAALPLLDEFTTSPASRRLVPAGPALGSKCELSWAQALGDPGQAGSTPEDPELRRIAHGLQARYASVRSVRADFTQYYRAPGVEQVESGTLLMKKPGLMRWEYRRPETKYFIADGSHTYLYAPADRQVMIGTFREEEIHSTPLQFLLGKGEVEKSFILSREPEFRPRIEGTGLLRLVPRTPQANYMYVVLEIDLRSHDLRALSIREHTGNISEFVLSNLAVNVQVSGKEFEFKVPRGVEVIRIDDK